MKLPVTLLGLGLMLANNTTLATGDIVSILPGLYAYQVSATLTPPGTVITEEAYEYCLTEELAQVSLSKLVAEASEGDCDMSQPKMSTGRGEADVSCNIEELGVRANGTMVVDYSDDSYRAVTTTHVDSPMGKMTIQSIVDAKRVGDCPDDWQPPEGISHK